MQIYHCITQSKVPMNRYTTNFSSRGCLLQPQLVIIRLSEDLQSPNPELPSSGRIIYTKMCPAEATAAVENSSGEGDYLQGKH